MGYMMHNGKLRIVDSDNAADFARDIELKIIAQLKEQMKYKDNCYNTDGVLNVALFLADVVVPGSFYRRFGYGLREFAIETLLPALKKYIRDAKKLEWGDKANRDVHMKAYKDLQSRIQEWIKEK